MLIFFIFLSAPQLEDVMETETYKKAKEILEKFDPVRFRKLEVVYLTRLGNKDQ